MAGPETSAERYVVISAIGAVMVITVASAIKGKFPSAKQGIATGFVYVGIAALADAKPALSGPLAGLAFASIALSQGLDFATGLGKVQSYKGAAPVSSAGSSAGAKGAGATPSVSAPFAPSSPFKSGGGIQGNIVAVAQSKLGVSYRWGGSNDTGYDCSGLTQTVYGAVGIKIPRVSTAQYLSFPRYSDQSALQPGDEVFFNWAPEIPPGHCGIYIGGGQFIHAPHTGDVVKVSNLSDYIKSGAKWYGFTRPYAKG